MQRKNRQPKRRKKRAARQRAQVVASCAIVGESEPVHPNQAEPCKGSLVQNPEANHRMSNNTVEVDQDALSLEARRVVDSAPADDLAPSADAPPSPAGEVVASPEEIKKGYIAIADLLVERVHKSAAPNWAFKPEKRAALTDALATAAMLWFPDGIIPPKYLALLVLAQAIDAIASDNYDEGTGAYRPLKLKNVTPAKPNPAATEAV